VAQALIVSPGPDSARLAILPLRLEPQPVMSSAELVTPPPAPLPSGGSWLDQQLRALADAVATGQTTYQQAQAEADRLKRQVNSLGIVGSLEQTLTDVHRAGQLQQMLPVVVLALGVLLGRPLLGAAAAAAVWYAGQDRR
jgi:hypothetical protein